MALTATATKASRESIIAVLQMYKPEIVSVVPCKDNIRYSVTPFESIEECVSPVIKRLLEHGTKADKVVIFCQKRELCSYIYLYMKSVLGPDNFVSPSGAPCVSEFRIVDCYTAAVDENEKKHIVSTFINPRLETSCFHSHNCIGNGT